MGKKDSPKTIASTEEQKTLFPATDMSEVFGRLKRAGPTLTVEEMDAAVEQEARRRARD